MGREISDLPSFGSTSSPTDTVADGDLLVCHNLSKADGTRDEKLTIDKFRTDALLARANTFTVGNQQVTSNSASNRALRLKAAANPTVPVLDVRNSSDVVSHELIADYGTNIVAARTMSGYQEFTISPGNMFLNTLTVDVVGNTFAHQAVFMEVIGAFSNVTDGTTNRATFVDDVVWRTRLNASTTATIDANTRRISSIGTATVTGPTAINGGIRYTVQGAVTNLTRTFMYIRVVSQSLVTVTATVA